MNIRLVGFQRASGADASDATRGATTTIQEKYSLEEVLGKFPERQNKIPYERESKTLNLRQCKGTGEIVYRVRA